MVVSITWSLSEGGGALTPPVDHGNIGNGESGAEEAIFIRHDGAEKIYNCGFYMANHDTAEILGWGADDVSGFLLDQNTHSGVSNYVSHKTGRGDNSGNAITLDGNSKIDAGDGDDGEIVASAEHEIHVKVVVPVAEDTAGTREFDQVLAYTYTS